MRNNTRPFSAIFASVDFNPCLDLPIATWSLRVDSTWSWAEISQANNILHGVQLQLAILIRNVYVLVHYKICIFSTARMYIYPGNQALLWTLIYIFVPRYAIYQSPLYSHILFDSHSILVCSCTVWSLLQENRRRCMNWCTQRVWYHFSITSAY